MGKLSKKSFKSCERHLMTLIPIRYTAKQSKEASHVFCWQRKSCYPTVPKFYKNPNITKYGFILPQDEDMLNKMYESKEDSSSDSRDLIISEESSTIWVPKPKQRICQICKAHYQDYKEHLSSLKHKEKHQANFFNKDILELCEIFGQIQETELKNPQDEKSFQQSSLKSPTFSSEEDSDESLIRKYFIEI